MSRIDDRLTELGLVLPTVPAPLAAYLPAVVSGSHVLTAGQLPLVDGALLHAGVVGDDVSPEQAIECARRSALNTIAAVASVIDLDRVVRIVKATVFVASAPGFSGQPAVANGASELYGDVFGEAGRHARSAVGVGVLPMNAPTEVELVVEFA